MALGDVDGVCCVGSAYVDGLKNPHPTSPRSMSAFGVRKGSIYRVVDEAATIENLALRMFGWVKVLHGGARSDARREAGEVLARWRSLGLPFAEGPAGRLYD